jgi:hypothetical protein
MNSIKSELEIKHKKSINRICKVSLTVTLIAFVVFTISPQSDLQVIKPAIAKTDNKLITTADIADNAVTSPKIKDGEVKTSDIEDGTITGDDVSTTFMKTIILKDDDTGHAHGWDPDYVTSVFDIYGISDVTRDSTIVAHLHDDVFPPCESTLVTNGGFLLLCDDNVAGGISLAFTVINAPVSPCCSAASATSTTLSANENNFSTSSSSPITSSPFSSLGDINPR